MKTKNLFWSGGLPGLLLALMSFANNTSASLTIRCPTDIRVWTCSTNSIIHYPSPVVAGACSSSVVIDCAPPSGHAFPIGSTTVTCRVIDACSNRDSCTFIITVTRDTTPPVIHCPSNIVVRTCGTNAAIVHFPPPTVTDNFDSSPKVVCSPASGSLFPAGTTTVTCTAADDCGNRSSCEFRVTIREDNQGPRINCPSNIVVNATAGDGAVVDFQVTANDDSLGPVLVVCDPPAGKVFPIGVTPVDCEATDGCGFSSVCSFEVIVQVPKLKVELSRNGMLVSWPGNAGLEESDSMDGPWRPVRGARSPHLVAATGAAQKFFRPLGFTAAPFQPTHRVEGRIRFNYVQRGPDILDSFDEPDYPQYAGVHTSIEIRAIRRARVVLEDDQGHYIKGKLNENGDYSFAWNPAVGQNGRITVWTVSHYGSRNAAVGRWIGPDISSTDELTANTSDYHPFSYTQTFSLADARIADGGLNLNITIPETDEAAQAFWILENGLVALDYFLGLDGVGSMPKLNIVYTPELPLEGGETAYYSSHMNPGFIFMPHDFGWIDFAIRHEVSHCFQRHYMRSRQAWTNGYWTMGEPLANAHALAMVGSSWMDKIQSFENVDVQPNFADEAFRLEDSNGNYWNYCTGCTGLDFKYGWPTRVLWDLLDGHQNSVSEPVTTYYPFQSDQLFDAGEFDLINGGASTSTLASSHLLNDVLINYLGGGVYGQESDHFQDRGATGLDIVDVLDGFICRGHATAQQLDPLINHAMMFGYPLDAPADCD